MRASPVALLLVTMAVTGCAEDPFVQREITQSVDKPINSITRNGQVTICHGDAAPRAQIEALAAEACGDYGYFAEFNQSHRYQCRVTAPHQSTFVCYHPEMTDAKGRRINPSDEKAIAEWQKRTGKMKPKPRVALPESQQHVVPATLPAGPAAATPAAPAATSTVPAAAAPTPYRPFSPADIAGKPDMAPAPILAEPPPKVPLYPSGSSYSLQPETWGQQFDK